MDYHTAVRYVQYHGDPIERARLDHVLFGRRPPKEALNALKVLQNPDGGFAYFFHNRAVSTVCDTLWIMSWVDDMGLQESAEALAGMTFLRSFQSADGGWDETSRVLELAPPSWLLPGKLSTRTWLTAYAGHILVRQGLADTGAAQAAARFLRAHQEDDGRIAGYQRATFIALPLFSSQFGSQLEACVNALAYLESVFSTEWVGSYLAWILRCTADAGLGAKHPFVRAGLRALEAAQRADGSWAGEDGPQYDVTSTIDALRAGLHYGLVPPGYKP